jgi:hypothetical protein
LKRIGADLGDVDLDSMAVDDLLALAEKHRIWVIPSKLSELPKDLDRKNYVMCVDMDIWVDFWREKYGHDEELFKPNQAVSEQDLRKHGFWFIGQGITHGFGTNPESGEQELIFSFMFLTWEGWLIDCTMFSHHTYTY